MSKIERFEDLKCWQAARALVRESYQAANEGRLKTDFDTGSQFKRAALSTMNNIAEGFGWFSTRTIFDFWIPLKAGDTKNLILGLIRYLRNRNQLQHFNPPTLQHYYTK